MNGKRKPPLLLRPRFVLFVLYVAIYVIMRVYGILGIRESAMGGKPETLVIEAKPGLEKWQRQFLRAVYSVAMVVEEEARLGVARSVEMVTRPVENKLREATRERDELLKEISPSP